MKQLEVCVFNELDALRAAELGAHRLEICVDYGIGGVSMALEKLENLAERLRGLGYFNEAGLIKGMVMVRPRGGDFVYTAKERLWMLEYRKSVMGLGFQGYVMGCLTEAGELDVAMLEGWQALKQGEWVFHRAFDALASVVERDWERIARDCRTLVEMGVDRVLTGMGSESMEDLVKLKDLGLELGLQILPGGGIRVHNLQAYLDLGFSWAHSAVGLVGENGFAMQENILLDMLTICERK